MYTCTTFDYAYMYTYAYVHTQIISCGGCDFYVHDRVLKRTGLALCKAEACLDKV